MLLLLDEYLSFLELVINKKVPVADLISLQDKEISIYLINLDEHNKLNGDKIIAC